MCRSAYTERDWRVHYKFISAEMAARQRTVEWTMPSHLGRSEPLRGRAPGSLNRLRGLGRRRGLGAAAPELSFGAGLLS
jgi:hypothetical protein